MKTGFKSSVRFLSLVAVFASAVVANAMSITILNHMNSSGIATSTFFRWSDLPQLNTTFGFGYFFDAGGNIVGGPASFFNGGSNLSIATVPGTASASHVANTYSFSGEWSQVSESNLGLTGGQYYAGTYSAYFDFTGLTSGLTVTGNVLPEPASIAGLGALVVGIARRRKAK